MVHHGDVTGFVLCVGVSLSEATQVARLLRDRFVVVAATDLNAARELLAPSSDVQAFELPIASTGTDGPIAGPLAAANVGQRPRSWAADRAVLSHVDVAAPPHAVLRAGRLTIDLAAREATVDTVLVHLSPREFDVLALLASDVGRVWSFAEITERVWGTEFLGDKEQLVSTVKRLRKRLVAGSGFEVRSAHGIGYRLRVDSRS